MLSIQRYVFCQSPIAFVVRQLHNAHILTRHIVLFITINDPHSIFSVNTLHGDINCFQSAHPLIFHIIRAFKTVRGFDQTGFPRLVFDIISVTSARLPSPSGTSITTSSCICMMILYPASVSRSIAAAKQSRATACTMFSTSLPP